MANENVVFAGVGRIRDQLILVSIFDRITSTEKHEIENTLNAEVGDALSKLGPGARDRKSFQGGYLYATVDRDLLCLYAVAIRNKNYSDRLAYAFLEDFMSLIVRSESGRELSNAYKAEALNKSLRKPIKDLMDRYDKPQNIDKTSAVMQKVDHVKGIMQVLGLWRSMVQHLMSQDNITNVLATHAHLADLENKTDDLSQNAHQFQQGAGNLRRQMWWSKMKITILLGIVGCAVLAYIIVMIIKLAT